MFTHIAVCGCSWLQNKHESKVDATVKEVTPVMEDTPVMDDTPVMEDTHVMEDTPHTKIVISGGGEAGIGIIG